MACVSFVFQAVIQFILKKVTNGFACWLATYCILASPKYKATIDESQINWELFSDWEYNK